LRFSLSTGTLYVYPLRLVFRWAHAVGFEGVELVVNPEAIARGGRAVRRIADEEGVEILTVQGTGAGVVVMHTPRSESLDHGEGLAFRQEVEWWQPRLAGRGLRLAVENKSIRAEADRAYALSPLDRLREFADRYDLGLVLDTTHAGTAGEDLLRAQRTFDGRLANVHVSDMGGRIPLSRLPPARTILGQHRFPGAGDLALADLLADLARDGYGGPVTLEVNPFALHIWWPPAVRRRLARALNWLKGAARQAAPDDG
jgi:sugar phosphate isomerase/epimerase